MVIDWTTNKVGEDANDWLKYQLSGKGLCIMIIDGHV